MDIRPRQVAHLVTVVGAGSEHGTVYTVECRADRADKTRYCVWFSACRHSTSGSDFTSFDSGDEAPCPDGGRHVMFQERDDGAAGWYRDTRKCRFAHYLDLDEAINNLELKRGIYLVEVSYEDWQAGEVDLATIATVGEPVDPGVISISARAAGSDRLWFGLESDIRDILCSQLPEEVDYDFEEGVVTIDVGSTVHELVRYLEGQPPSFQAPPPLSGGRHRPIHTINTGGLL